MQISQQEIVKDKDVYLERQQDLLELWVIRADTGVDVL